MNTFVSTRARLLLNSATVLLCIFFIFPIYWMIKGSFEPTQDLLSANLIPDRLTVENYRGLFETNFITYLLNSTIIAVGTTVLTVTLSTMAGYGLARFQLRGRKLLARGILFTYMFPGLALAIPLFIIFSNLQLTNTRFGLVLAHSSITLPFGIWLMWQFFQTVSRSYQETAYTLGAGSIRTMVEVELPLARPGIIAVSIFAFALSWEDYTLAFILTSSDSARTIPVGMTSFVEQDVIHWGLIESAGVFMLVPPLLIVLLLQRHLVRGLGAGGLKG